MPASGRPFLEVRAITKLFRAGTNSFTRLFSRPVPAIEDVSFAVRRGDLVGVYGEAGAGKTTLARIIAGLEPPSSGQVALDGAAASARVLRDRATLLDDAAAQATTDLVIADDPPPPTGASSRSFLASLNGDTTLIAFSDDLATVSQASQIAVLYRGRLVEAGPAAGVLGAPVQPYTRALLEQGPHASKEEPRPTGCPYHPICPYVMEICKTRFPPLEAKAPGHLAACHAVVAGPQGPAFRPDAGSARRLNRLRQREVMGTPE